MAASSLAGIVVGAFAHAVVAGNPSAARCDDSVRRAIAFITGGLAAPPVTQPAREAGPDPSRPPQAAPMNDVHPDTQPAPRGASTRARTRRPGAARSAQAAPG